MWSEIYYGTIGLATCFLAYNIIPISSYLFNLATLSPGTGRVFMRKHPKSKKKGLFIDTNVGRIKIPFVKLPSPDTEIYFFKDESMVHHNHIVGRTYFMENYQKLEFEPLKRYDMGIIADFIHPTDYKNKRKVCGFISSLFEDYIYLFAIDDELIDYEKLFEEYHDALNNFDVIKLD